MSTTISEDTLPTDATYNSAAESSSSKQIIDNGDEDSKEVKPSQFVSRINFPIHPAAEALEEISRDDWFNIFKKKTGSIFITAQANDSTGSIPSN